MLQNEEHFDKMFIEDISYAKEFKSPVVLFMADGSCVGLGDDYSYAKIETGFQKKARTLFQIGLETKSFAKIIKGQNESGSLDLIDTPLYIKTPYADIKKLPGVQELQFGVSNFITQSLAIPIIYQGSLDIDFSTAFKNLKADEGGMPYVIANRFYIILHKRILSYIASDKVYVNIRYIQGQPSFICEFMIVTKKGFIFNEFIRGLMV